MPTKQGDLSLLNDPVAQELLHSPTLARVAYTWTDGTPRVIPIWFHWTGEEIVLGTPPTAPKLKALRQHPQVAITIDTEAFPSKVLLIRGTATVEIIDGIVPEYMASARRYLGETGGQEWLNNVKGLNITQMARVAIRPEWVGIIDFQSRFPSAIERAIEEAQTQQPASPQA